MFCARGDSSRKLRRRLFELETHVRRIVEAPVPVLSKTAPQNLSHPPGFEAGS